MKSWFSFKRAKNTEAVIPAKQVTDAVLTFQRKAVQCHIQVRIEYFNLVRTVVTTYNE